MKKYTLVRVSKLKALVARIEEDGSYKAITKTAPNDVAEKIYTELTIYGFVTLEDELVKYLKGF